MRITTNTLCSLTAGLLLQAGGTQVHADLPTFEVVGDDVNVTWCAELHSDDIHTVEIADGVSGHFSDSAGLIAVIFIDDSFGVYSTSPPERDEWNFLFGTSGSVTSVIWGEGSGVCIEFTVLGVGSGGDPDGDGDGVPDAEDNCPETPNGDQADFDGDGRGDVCDNCPITVNADQANSDADSFGNVCDNCPATDNEDQADFDFDGLGDLCDECPNDPDNDLDQDGVCGDVDCEPNSDMSATIIIDGFDTGVPNLFFEDGCTSADLIADSAELAANQGEFIRLVAQQAIAWKKAGYITGNEMGAIVSGAAQAGNP